MMNSTLKPDPRNANLGTQRGEGQLERSLQQYGAGRSILANDIKNAFIIYVLCDPETGDPRYIGKTIVPALRRYHHMKSAQVIGHKTRSQAWIFGLLSRGLEPDMWTVEFVCADTWQDRERFWIAEFTRKGADLTNLTEGGDGNRGLRFSLSDEAKAKISAARTGMTFTEEHKAKLRDRKNELWQTERGMAIRNEYSRKYAALTDEQVIEIWRLATTKAMTQQAIADKFGIPNSTVSQIKSGKRYKHVARPTDEVQA